MIAELKKLCCLFCMVLTLTQAFALGGKDDWKKTADNPAYLHRAIKKVTDMIVHDVFSPPVASRTYAYISVAAYEAARHAEKGSRSMAGQLHGLTPIPEQDPSKKYNYSVAAVHAVLLVGKAMVISEDSMQLFDQQMMKEFAATGMPAAVLNESIKYGDAIAAHILAWAAKDNYKQTRSYPKYTVSEDISSWKPTAPAYMKAIEPHWNKMRPFVIDSAQQFKPPAAIPFSADKNSAFYQTAMEVYITSKKLTNEQIDIANFWDCNPFKMNVNGHVMFATKKISPGGHWVNIAGAACMKTKTGLVKSAAVYACLSVILADAFIICWDEKYRSNVIRPETYISQFIDEAWMPILQTPPFPEYTSGHSVVSAACSEFLTRQFGENFSYTDSTELEFGIPVRHFKSFQEAAEEAAISRLYGGIHYMPAITFGLAEGKKMAQLICSRLQMNN